MQGSALKRATLISIGIIIPLLALEVVIRLAALFAPEPPRVRKERPARYFIKEHAADIRGNRSLNCLTGQQCIVVIGDSFTFGASLQSEDAFPRRLERFLNLNAAAQPIQVINLGVSGANAIQEARLLHRFLHNNQPDLVLLQITLNDAKVKTLGQELPEVQRHFKPYSPPALIAPLTRRFVSLRYLLHRIHNSRSRKAYIDYHQSSFRDDLTGKQFRKALTNMANLTEERSVPFAMVLFPLFDFPLDQSYPFKPEHQLIQEIASSLKTPFLDLFERFKGMDHVRLQLIPGKDSHPNEIAHRIAAEEILLFLRHNRLVAPDNLPERVYRDRNNLRERRIKNKVAFYS